MRILVQKFGGTSLADAATRHRVAERVAEAVSSGWATVVVVSAMGRSGAPYATDTLLSLVSDAALPARDHDLLASCGETISAVVMAAALRGAGLDTAVLTGGEAGIVTNDTHGNAAIIQLHTDRIQRHLGLGQTVVVAGFQGATAAGAVTTLGRGGSDISAVAIGGALGAELVEIYTDVDGVQTADPRLVPKARTIAHMTYDETSQLTHEGAKVLHPRAAEMAARFKLPVRIRSTFTDGPGTLVSTENGDSPWAPPCYTWPVTGVTHTPSLAHVSFDSGQGDTPPFGRSFRVLAGLGINVDMISVTPHGCSFVVPAGAAASAAGQALQQAGIAARVRCDVAKVCVVGRGMRDTPGVMARVSEALLDAGVGILHTSDSLMTISCLVQQDDLGRAVRALHTAFGLDAKEEPSTTEPAGGGSSS